MNFSMSERRRAWVGGGALFALLLVLAALRPLALPDEGRYGDIGRWMLQSGDWMTPRLDGLPFFHKPPYLHWLQALTLGALGVSAWSARLVPALHAGLMLVMVYVALQRLADAALARRAGLMLGSSLAFLLGGQYINHDMLVACWISVAIWSFALAFAHGPTPHAGWARLGFAACALGVLSKMLIGLVLPGLVLLLWLLWTRQWRKILRLPWLSGLGLFALLALPWFVLEQQNFAQMFGYMFGTQQFGRYTGSSFNNAQPWWFYLPVLALLLFPWAFFVPAQALGQWRQWRAAAQAQGGHTSVEASASLTSLCWIWLLAIGVFFSIPHSKIVGYMLPVVPPLATLAALGWQRVLGPSRWQRRWLVALLAVSLALALVATLAAGKITERRSTQDIAHTLACQAGRADTVYAVGEYPYDLPFYAQLTQPMVVVQDWPTLRQTAGDNWRRELFEGADFDSEAAKVLQTPQVLPQAASQMGRWLVAPNGYVADPANALPGWVVVQRGQAWTLLRSGPERPEPAQNEGLGGCTGRGQKPGQA